MDRLLISGEDLDFSGSYNISFEANDFLNFKPGTAYKSERLTIYNTPKNCRLLQNIFHINTAGAVTFPAFYISPFIQMTGIIQILQVDQKKAEAVFISGNGALWDNLKGVKLNDKTKIDCSEYDHELNLTKVVASETVTDSSFYLYDFTERGTKIDTGKVSITERYPAINLKNLLLKIFNGYTLAGDLINEAWFKKIFLLFTQTDQINNSEEWKKSALISVGKTAGQSEALSVSAPDFTLTQKQVSFVETSPFFDNGGNFASNTFTAPETGAYNFRFTRAATLALGATAEDVIGTVTFSIKKNDTTIVAQEVYTLLDQPTNSIAAATIATNTIQLTAGDTIKCFIEVVGTFTGSIAFGSALVLTNACTLINSVSRWYGSGATVEMDKVLPDVDSLIFLSDLFVYFGLFPLYDVETKTINFYQLKADTTVNNLSAKVDPDGVAFEIPEPANYYLKFAQDSSDKILQFAIDNELMIDGNYEYNIGEKETKEIRLKLLCNTFMDYGDFSYPYKIPKLWADVEGKKYSTKFGLRLLYYAGDESITYTLTHGLSGGVTETTRNTIPILTNLDTTDGVNLNFAAVGTLQGMFQFQSRALQMAAFGKVAQCTVKLSNAEISQFYSCTGNDLRVPIFIESKYISGRFMILKAKQKAGNIFELTILQKID